MVCLKYIYSVGMCNCVCIYVTSLSIFMHNIYDTNDICFVIIMTSSQLTLLIDWLLFIQYNSVMVVLQLGSYLTKFFLINLNKFFKIYTKIVNN